MAVVNHYGLQLTMTFKTRKLPLGWCFCREAGKDTVTPNFGVTENSFIKKEKNLHKEKNKHLCAHVDTDRQANSNIYWYGGGGGEGGLQK